MQYDTVKNDLMYSMYNISIPLQAHGSPEHPVSGKPGTRAFHLMILPWTALSVLDKIPIVPLHFRDQF
ncbi:MAG: hypothetical protein JRN19_04105 [Nitrososphaerota archaeon]|nr:hypothetical protein [Nitrososphaerota archaeon]MDG7049239.1 hypothetical protein [Nitrososphaerota archaeon]MDG7051615.1 hypothetical protein [Nitrososphaerota archaeon]